ncbi:MAG: hypothetical protein ABI650_06360, partial [Dokdonella sp.]
MNTLIDVMPWVHALGLSLVHFIWQGLLIGALFALARAMIPVEHSSLRYASGLAALALLALCPLATVWMLRPASEMLLVSAADPVAVRAGRLMLNEIELHAA